MLNQIFHVAANIANHPGGPGGVCREISVHAFLQKRLLNAKYSPRYSTLDVCPHPGTLVSTPATLLLLPEVLKMNRELFTKPLFFY